MFKTTAMAAASFGLVATLAGAPAQALVITPATGTSDSVAQALALALLGSNPDFELVAGSATYQGNTTAAGANGGTYSGFSLSATGSSPGPTFTLGNGVVLSSSVLSTLPGSNTTSDFSSAPGSGSNALLTGIAPGAVDTFDANVLGFRVVRKAGSTATAIKTTFQFMTDEVPTQAVTDIFGFFVDGTNYARFADGSVVANDTTNPNNLTNFTLNETPTSSYDIEFNGLSAILQVTGVLDPTLAEHQIYIGVADTSDDLFDSIAFITGLAGSTDDGGIIVPPPPPPPPPPGVDVPAPGSLALLAVGLVATSLTRRRRARD